MEEYLLEFLHKSENAILVKDCEDSIWLPLSQIEIEDDLECLERGDFITVFIPDWLAEEKELV